MKESKVRKLVKRGKPLLVDEMLREYEMEQTDGTYSQEFLWRVGYLCACRDAGLLTKDQWNDRLIKERKPYGSKY